MSERLAPVGLGPIQATIRARRPSNRSEVCAGMRQYMKCRRPVWRHVKAGGKVCVAGHAMIRCAWRAGCRQFTRRRKACHSIFVSFDVRRLFAAVDRKLCRQLLLSLCRRCVPTERANPPLCNAQDHRWPRSSLSLASNEVNVKICGGYWGGDGQEETSPGAASAVSRRANCTPKEHQRGRYSRS